MTNNFSRRWWAHALAWSAFITYEVSILLITSTPQRVFWWEYAGFYALNILLFYTNAHLVLTYSLSVKRAPFLLLLLIPLQLATYIILQYELDFLLNLFRPAPKLISLNQKFILGYIWRGIYFIGLSAIYWFVRHTIRNTRKIGQLELQQLEAEREKADLEKNLVRSQNAYLQAQINPHFLFNTLNFIYNSVQEVSSKASESVLLLSEVMRYALTEVHKDGRTDLASEIEHLQKYIALNQLRYQRPLHLAFQLEGQLDMQRIPPLLLLTFIENMYRHGDLTDAQHPASVIIQVKGYLLSFRTKNKKRISSLKTDQALGLENVRTRLKNFYSVKDYLLDIQEDKLNYMVHLQIKLA